MVTATTAMTAKTLGTAAVAMRARTEPAAHVGQKPLEELNQGFKRQKLCTTFASTRADAMSISIDTIEQPLPRHAYAACAMFRSVVQNIFAAMCKASTRRKRDSHQSGVLREVIHTGRQLAKPKRRIRTAIHGRLVAVLVESRVTM